MSKQKKEKKRKPKKNTLEEEVLQKTEESKGKQPTEVEPKKAKQGDNLLEDSVDEEESPLKRKRKEKNGPLMMN